MSRAAVVALAVATLATLAGLGACGGTSAPPAEPDAAIGADVTVTAFDGEHVYFGTENRRTVDAPVSFPAPGQRYERVTLHLAVRCPTGGCDWWDRLGRLSLVYPGATPEEDRELELARFITPYRVAGDFTVDVTGLQRVLEGDATVRVFIDTWVGPGHANGAGWLVDASFEFVGGTPTREPFAVVPLWAPAGIVYGDPARPTAREVTVDIPDGVTGAELRALITGHGQGNADNCAEFCSRDHAFDVGGTAVTRTVWRDDCATTATPGQQGTWQYPRAGWCPGAMVEPWVAEVPAPAAGALTVGYDVAAFENTCRPDATTCAGCTLGSGCDYDGGNHTEPNYQQSAVLILYR
ncbi:MAG: hypothetical protein H6709_19820 [Kofleriaceae bacterium]|nr:hypothetical protein [Kofleriaceae bacterium]MCB9574334.1 hypothetical protein [Kofleriaceae bacterium]